MALDILSLVLSVLLGLGLIGFVVWVPTEFLRRAGYSRWWVLMLFLTGFLGLIMFAILEWPIERENAWYRMRDGERSEELIARVERFAVELEKAGDWNRASRVFGDLSRATSGEAAAYYVNCMERLGERIGDHA